MSAPVPPSGGRRRGHTALITAAVLACVMAMFVAVLATRGSAVDKQARSPLLGRSAPAVDATSIDGGALHLSSYAGKYVLVNFFATWCIPCQREHPELEKWMVGHAAKGDVTVFGVVFDDTAANARQFMQQNGGDWPVADDPGGQIALDFGVRGPPESFMINPDGIVLAKYVGQVTADGLDRLIARAEGA